MSTTKWHVVAVGLVTGALVAAPAACSGEDEDLDRWSAAVESNDAAPPDSAPPDGPPPCPPSCDDGEWCNGTETCDVATGNCVSGTPPDCDDGQWCNGTETCNESTDSCDPGTAPTCDDGQWCNGTETCNESTDSCDPGSEACPDPDFLCNETTDTCECANCDCGPAVCTELGVGFGVPNVGFSVPCGPFGEIGFNGDATINAGGTTCSCPDCKDTVSGGVKVTAYAGFCGVYTDRCSADPESPAWEPGLKLDFSGHRDWEYCKRCNDSTCEEECQELKEIKTGGSASGSVCFKGWVPGFSLGGSANLRLVSVDMHCGAKATASFGANGGFDMTDGVGTQADCLGEDCNSLTGGINAGAGISGDCEFIACFWNWCQNFNINDVLYGKIDANANLTKNWGDCGDDTCVTGGVAVEGGANPTVNFKFRRWKFCAHAQAALNCGCSKSACNKKWKCECKPKFKVGLCR
jgi:hypothetical protein